MAGHSVWTIFWSIYNDEPRGKEFLKHWCIVEVVEDLFDEHGTWPHILDCADRERSIPICTDHEIIRKQWAKCGIQETLYPPDNDAHWADEMHPMVTYCYLVLRRDIPDDAYHIPDDPLDLRYGTE